MANANTTATAAGLRAGRKPALPATCIQHLEPPTRRLVERALRALENSAVYRAEPLNDPATVRAHLKLRLAGLEREEFHALWLDAQHRLIEAEIMSVGTLTCAPIYPREFVRSALRNNAAAVIVAHNHPSGVPEPSAADERMTHSLKTALAVVDVQLLDHFIVAGDAFPLSFAERGLL